MSTSLKDLFDVEISSATKGVTEVGFGTVLILGSTGFGSSPDIVRTYSQLTDVAADFATTDPEYLAAESILDQDPTIQQIKVGKRAALVAQIDNIVVGTAVDNHNYIVQVNGVPYTYNSGSGSSIASIKAGLLAAIIAGADPIYVASAGGTGTVILTAVTPGVGFATVTEDADLSVVHATANHGVADDIIAIQAVDDDWYMLALTSRIDSDILGAAAYIESQLKMFGYCTSNSNDPTSSGAGVGAKIFALKYNRSFGLWSAGQATYPEVGWMATNHFTPGNEGWAYQSAAGSVADKLSPTQRQNLRAKNMNTYETYAGNDVFLFGIVASGEYIDVIRLRDWTVSQMQERLFGASINAAVTVGKVPYDDNGGAIYHSVLLGVLTDGENNNGYVKGTSQVNVPLVKSQSQANRQARKMAGITFTSQLDGAVYTGAINGVVTV